MVSLAVESLLVSWGSIYLSLFFINAHDTRVLFRNSFPVYTQAYFLLSLLSESENQSFCCGLSWGFYSCDKCNNQKPLGEEKIYFANTFTSLSITEGGQGKNSKQKPGGGSWSRGHEGTVLTACSPWLAHLALLQYLGPAAQGWLHPLRDDTWVFPHQSLIRKILYRLTYRPNLHGGKFSIGVLSSQMTESLCHDDMNLAITLSKTVTWAWASGPQTTRWPTAAYTLSPVQDPGGLFSLRKPHLYCWVTSFETYCPV